MNFDTNEGEQFRNVYLDSDRVTVQARTLVGASLSKSPSQVGLGGVKFMSADDGRTLRSYPLNHISKWSLRESFLILYVKTPSDLDERPLTLHGEERAMRSMLDTLTSCCMQMVELLDSQKEAEPVARPRASAAAPSRPDPLEIPFWSEPDKVGWLQSQGDTIKTWRRRWFVLKGGFLYRFMDSKDVKPGAKPRGILDLHKATDVGDGRGQTGRPNSIRVVIENVQHLFLLGSETETVEWMSALEGAMHRAIKTTAGVRQEPPAPAVPATNDLIRTLESSLRTMERHGAPNPASRNPAPNLYGAPANPPPRQPSSGYGGYYPSSNFDAPPAHVMPSLPLGMVAVTGYDGPSANAAGYGAPSQAYGTRNPQDEWGLYQQGGIAGVAGVVRAAPEPQFQPPLAPGYSPAAPAAQASYGGYGASVQAPQAAPMQAPPPQQGSSWQMHYTPDGKPYYHNASTGTTQWDPPSSFI